MLKSGLGVDSPSPFPYPGGMKIAKDITTGEYIIVDGSAHEVVAITDIPASDVEGASRWIRYSAGVVAVYASEAVQVA